MKTRPLQEALEIVPNDDVNLVRFESLDESELQIVASSMILRVYKEGIENADREDHFEGMSTDVAPNQYLRNYDYPLPRLHLRTVFDDLREDCEYRINDLGFVNLAKEEIDFVGLYRKTIYARQATGSNEVEYHLCVLFLDIATRVRRAKDSKQCLQNVFGSIFKMNRSLCDQLGIIQFSDIDDFLRALRSKKKSFLQMKSKQKSKKSFEFSAPTYLKAILKNLNSRIVDSFCSGGRKR